MQEKAVTDINAGKPFGLSRWVRFQPESGKFFLFEYLEIFMQRLGVLHSTWCASCSVLRV